MEGVAEHKNRQPPPLGYPTFDYSSENSKQGAASPQRAGQTRARGRKTSFIDGCIAALCCCWLCDLCCD